MATETDICNLALAHLGDDATVTSIDPPEGSPQATHCARFYPVSRATLQDMTNWSFCTTRATLTQLSATPLSGWLYAYAQPSDAVNILSIHKPGSTDDFDPQSFDMEQLPDGTTVIYTNVAGAICRYTRHITDPSKFPPLFVETLSWLLASQLAGPLLKGEAGRAATLSAYQMFKERYNQAATSDAANRRIDPTHSVTWVAQR